MNLTTVVFLAFISMLNCPSLSGNSSQEDKIKNAVKSFNEAPASVHLGFEFKCSNPKSTHPILSIYTTETYDFCKKKLPQFKYILSLILVAIPCFFKILYTFSTDLLFGSALSKYPYKSVYNSLTFPSK